MIEDLLLYIQQNAELAPYMIFGMLLLAGFNLPVSEDAMLLASALLAIKRPDLQWQLFAGVYAGAYFSDLICYGLGRTLGPRLWQIKWFAKMVSQDRVDQISSYYDRFGMITLVLGRFIPFGVRNALFLTAGIGKMPFPRFALSDLLAATISCSFFFWLYLSFGESVIDYVKRGNLVLFSVALVVVTLLVLRKRRARRMAKLPVDGQG